jgi:hypothetical protein
MIRIKGNGMKRSGNILDRVLFVLVACGLVLIGISMPAMPRDVQLVLAACGLVLVGIRLFIRLSKQLPNLMLLMLIACGLVLGPGYVVYCVSFSGSAAGYYPINVGEPLELELGPHMNPIRFIAVINYRVYSGFCDHFSATYRASLKEKDRELWTGTFSVSHQRGRGLERQHCGTNWVHKSDSIRVFSVERSGRYVFLVTPKREKSNVVVRSVALEVHKNVTGAKVKVPVVTTGFAMLAVGFLGGFIKFKRLLERGLKVTERGSRSKQPVHLSPPPRNIPILLLIRLYFGGGINQFGWIFFVFWLLFFWIFDPITSLILFYKFNGELEKVEGVVLGWEETSATETNVRGDEENVYLIRYFFKLPDGHQYFGKSYSAGKYLLKGSPVVVEYPKGNPSISRIKGMRANKFSPTSIFFASPSIIGLGFIIRGLKNGRKAHRLFQQGTLTWGRLKSKVWTRMGINERPVYELTFEFVAEDGKKYQAIAKTHVPEDLEDEEQERLLYDPKNPAYSVMLDSLPALPIVDEIANKEIEGAVVLLIAPCLSIIGYGIYVYLILLQFLS